MPEKQLGMFDFDPDPLPDAPLGVRGSRLPERPAKGASRTRPPTIEEARAEADAEMAAVAKIYAKAMMEVLEHGAEAFEDVLPEIAPAPTIAPDPETRDDFRECVRDGLKIVILEALEDGRKPVISGEDRRWPHCHWPGCPEKVLGNMWVCPDHWILLPVPMRERLSRTFDRGREQSGTDTEAFRGVAADVYRWIELSSS